MDNNLNTILLADDNPENLGVLSKILEHAGYKVRTAQNGQLALNSIKAAPPDLALIDLHMPVMDGYELCKQMKNDSRYAHIPVLFISAIGESFNKVIAFELGAVDFIPKPADPKEVLSRVGAHLKIQRLQKELKEKNQELEAQVSERTAELETALEELKVLNKKLCFLDQAKSDFLRLISHELRTPLVGLGIVDELLNAKDLSEEDSKSYQNIFWASHQKLINIVDHATVLTRLNLKKAEYKLDSQVIHQLVKSSLETLQPLLEASEIAIKLTGDKKETLYFDHEYGKMVFNAMVETAIKFTDKGKTVLIDWEKDSAQIIVHIHAEGWVLPEKHAANFFEVLSINETIFPGGDLGLAPAVAKQVMNVCGGKIKVSNRSSDGITITIIFPDHRPSE